MGDVERCHTGFFPDLPEQVDETFLGIIVERAELVKDCEGLSSHQSVDMLIKSNTKRKIKVPKTSHDSAKPYD